MPFLDPIRQNFDNGIPKNVLTGYVKKIMKWAQGLIQLKDLPDERKHQLHELSSMFSAFKQILAPLSEPIQYSDIEKMILRIYRPMNYSWQQSEQGSQNVINDLGGMAVPARTLIWLDCQAEEVERDPYDFLSTTERHYLDGKGVQILNFAQHLKNRRYERNRLLNSVTEQVVLVQSNYDGIQRLGEHSLVAEVKHLLKDTFQLENADNILPIIQLQTETKPIDLFQSQQYYIIENLTFPGRTESNSSIETLIQRPFNYVMHYVADLKIPEDEQLKSPYTTQDW